MRELPPISALRAFEAAARLGSLSAAGRELNVTHAAIAQQVKRLEQWFAVPLLERQGRGVAVTDAGRDLAAGLERGFGMIFDSVAALSDRNATRPVCLTATPSFTANWLFPRLNAFRVAHPDIELMIDPTSRLIDLAAVGFDVGFRYGKGDWPGVDAVRLVTSDTVIGVASSLLGDATINEPRDLLNWPRLQEYGSDEWRTWFEAHGVADSQVSNTIHVPGNFAVDGIRRGLGVGITARTWLQADIAAGLVVTVLDEETTGDLGYYIVTRPGPQRPQVKAFVGWAIRMGELDRDKASSGS